MISLIIGAIMLREKSWFALDFATDERHITTFDEKFRTCNKQWRITSNVHERKDN